MKRNPLLLPGILILLASLALSYMVLLKPVLDKKADYQTVIDKPLPTANALQIKPDARTNQQSKIAVPTRVNETAIRKLVSNSVDSSGVGLERVQFTKRGVTAQVKTTVTGSPKQILNYVTALRSGVELTKTKQVRAKTPLVQINYFKVTSENGQATGDVRFTPAVYIARTPNTNNIPGAPGAPGVPGTPSNQR